MRFNKPGVIPEEKKIRLAIKQYIREHPEGSIDWNVVIVSTVKTLRCSSELESELKAKLVACLLKMHRKEFDYSPTNEKRFIVNLGDVHKLIQDYLSFYASINNLHQAFEFLLRSPYVSKKIAQALVSQQSWKKQFLTYTAFATVKMKRRWEVIRRAIKKAKDADDKKPKDDIIKFYEEHAQADWDAYIAQEEAKVDASLKLATRAQIIGHILSIKKFGHRSSTTGVVILLQNVVLTEADYQSYFAYYADDGKLNEALEKVLNSRLDLSVVARTICRNEKWKAQYLSLRAGDLVGPRKDLNRLHQSIQNFMAESNQAVSAGSNPTQLHSGDVVNQAATKAKAVKANESINIVPAESHSAVDYSFGQPCRKKSRPNSDEQLSCAQFDELNALFFPAINDDSSSAMFADQPTDVLLPRTASFFPDLPGSPGAMNFDQPDRDFADELDMDEALFGGCPP